MYLLVQQHKIKNGPSKTFATSMGTTNSFMTNFTSSRDMNNNSMFYKYVCVWEYQCVPYWTKNLKCYPRTSKVKSDSLTAWNCTLILLFITYKQNPGIQILDRDNVLKDDK
jgi:hypothetical protein